MNRQIVPVKGDGNCLFRALSYFVKGETGKYKQVRTEIVNYITQHWEIFKESIFAEYSKQTATDYANFMGKDLEHGGYPELTAFSKLYNCCIVIFFVSGTYPTSICSENKNEPKYAIIYSGDGYNGHFSVLESDILPKTSLEISGINNIPICNKDYKRSEILLNINKQKDVQIFFVFVIFTMLFMFTLK